MKSSASFFQMPLAIRSSALGDWMDRGNSTSRCEFGVGDRVWFFLAPSCSGLRRLDQINPKCSQEASPAGAVSRCMDTTNPTATAFRNLGIAADETLHVLCRLRGITIDDLSEEALQAFFFQALDDEFWVGTR